MASNIRAENANVVITQDNVANIVEGTGRNLDATGGSVKVDQKNTRNIVSGVAEQIPQLVSDVDDVNVVKSDEEVYNNHLSNDNVYKIPKDKKKQALIINMSVNRKGSEFDFKNTKKLFKYLGFRVQAEEDLPANEMGPRVEDFVEGLGKVSVCALIVMSHGKDGDLIVCGDGNTVSAEDLISKFVNEELVGIPKLFFFQCCRGTKVMKEVADGRTPPPDSVVVFPCKPGYVSFRDGRKGSWFINALVRVFMKQSCNTDVEKMLRFVNQEVKKMVVTNPDDPDLLGGRQLCDIESSLTGKQLSLFPGFPK